MDLLFLSRPSVSLRCVGHVPVVEVTEYILMAAVRHVDNWLERMRYQVEAS